MRVIPPGRPANRAEGVALLGDTLSRHDCLTAEREIARLRAVEQHHKARIRALTTEVHRLRAVRTHRPAPRWVVALALLTLAHDRLLGTASRRHNAACVAIVVACVALARVLGGL